MTRKPREAPPSSRPPKGPKRLASSTSTGGGGVTYESRVQALYLLAMFTGWPTPLQQDATIEELRFQARIHGYSTDDLVCTLLDEAGGRRKALLQVKLALKALPSDKAFSDAISAAWRDYKNNDLFQKNRDRLVIVYARDVDGGMQSAAQLTQYARTSLSGDESEQRSEPGGEKPCYIWLSSFLGIKILYPYIAASEIAVASLPKV